jgi:hypothetical protein
MTTASPDVRDNDRTTQATPFGRGAGHVAPGSPNQKGSSFQPGLVYDAGFLEYLGFLCDADRSVFANPEATCGALESLGIPVEATDLNLASIGVSQLAGSATIKRTVTSVAQESGNRTYQVSVNAPSGYTATVSPSSFTLRTGQSATYEVTFTNVSAPIGEWRFGSLTWADQTGNYRVTSPIALRGSEFNAPAEITGTGVSGNASFEVRFGYTGPYEARAQGLIQATETNDNVVQDPDQNFDPNDGFSDAHVFALADASVFRVAIPPEATEANADLDVYVYDPSNQLVASSTLGGTDEEVTIHAPANGNWTVYVHGWQAPGGDSNYTLFSWQVPNATGGSLTATGPASATAGSVGTVNLNWTGAVGWNLGAVAHMRGGDVLGRTLVEVDNRP